VTLDEAVGPIGAACLRDFASAAAKAFPGQIEQVVLLLPVHPASDFPHQVAVILRMEPCVLEEEEAILRKAHIAFERAALPATMEGQALHCVRHPELRSGLGLPAFPGSRHRCRG
jgi:hypothetical protein